MYFWKMVSTFHKNYPEKPTAISALLDSAPPIAKLTIQLPTKRKRKQSIGCGKKRIKWGDKEKSELVHFFRAKSQQVAGNLSF